MAKEKPTPRSQKSNRGHDRFKDLYANQKTPPPPTTPELAHRAPRQVPVTPTTSDGVTTANTTSNDATPVTKTPKKPHKPAHKPKKAKWSHVPSASDGDATHFENFENDGAAQLAVAKMKTRKLQWSKETVTEEGGGGGKGSTGTVDGSTDAGESFRQEIESTGTGGSTGGSGGSAGSQNELRLKALERTQDEGPWKEEMTRDCTKEDPDQKEVRQEPKAPGLKSPQPSPPKAKEPAKTVATAPAPPPVVVTQPPAPPPPPPAPVVVPTPPPVAAPVAVPVIPAQAPQQVTKREQRNVSVVKQKKASSRDRKPAAAPAKNNNTTVTGEVTTRDKRQTGVKKEGGEPTSANYLLAVKLMKILKRNNYLENALRFEDNEKVRKHFESCGFAQTPPPPILSLLHRALDFVLETVLFRADDLDTGISNELRVFIIKKQEARESMLQVLFNRPDLMPNKWGGARANSVKRSKTSKSTDGNKKGGWWSSLFR